MKKEVDLEKLQEIVLDYTVLFKSLYEGLNDKVKALEANIQLLMKERELERKE